MPPMKPRQYAEWLLETAARSESKRTRLLDIESREDLYMGITALAEWVSELKAHIKKLGENNAL